MFGWRRRPVIDGFPKGFRPQPIHVDSALFVAELPPEEIATYFRNSPRVATRLLDESYDKRYSPSTFLTEESDGFSVGWYSTDRGYQCVRRFANLADAATDYLLSSLGKARWTPPEATQPQR